MWCTVKYEEVYLKAYATVLEAKRGLEDYFRVYNGLRPCSTDTGRGIPGGAGCWGRRVY